MEKWAWQINHYGVEKDESGKEEKILIYKSGYGDHFLEAIKSMGEACESVESSSIVGAFVSKVPNGTAC